MQAFDPKASFEGGSPGCAAERVIDFDGKERLDRTVWEAGLVAYEFLKTNCEDAISPDGYRHWVASAKEFLTNDFYPDFLVMLRDGRAGLSGGSLEDFQTWWAEYDWVQQLEAFLGLVEHGRTHMAATSPEADWFKGYVAIALLWRIDDAVISDFCDGRGLIENVVAIMNLRNLLSSQTPHAMSAEAAIEVARKRFAKSGAAAKLAKDPKQMEKGAVRECWDAWQRDRSRYKGVAAFARDMLQKFENLESQQVIERWCRAWTKKSQQENL
ncbi:hypothetical protein VLK31_28335 [Variovorax sp. H27-G14]|uniref:hypothetical protein n=1 Tax=Variovorax sp. H27-G14 TaxID=3111914 RepID=UPI0038FCC88D